MSGGYNAKVVAPDLYKLQTESGGFQKPFYFGGAQTPTALFLKKDSFSGSGMTLTHSNPNTPKKQIVLPLR